MLIFQLALFCLLFTGMVKFGVRGAGINGIFFYPKPVQERVVALGLIDWDAIRRKKRRFMIPFLLILLTALLLIIGLWNGISDFKTAYWQALLFLEVMPPIQYKAAVRRSMPAWALKFMGQTEEGMRTMLSRIPDHVSLESIRATWAVGLNLYRTQLSVREEVKTACWYGEKEGHMKNAIEKLRRVYPSLTVRCFESYGHGDIMNHPEQLTRELICFLES